MIAFSAIYAVLIAKDRDLAEAAAVGYIALLLTIFVIVNTWKKHHDHHDRKT
jgi:hypothetical protein